MSALNEKRWHYDQSVQCLSDLHHGEISGLYYNDPFNMGVTYSGPPAHHPAIANPTDLEQVTDTKMGCALSIVQMKNVGQIDVWYTVNRCMGLLITFTDNRQDTLGRWDEGSDEFHRETLFKQEYNSPNFDSMRIALKEYWRSGYAVNSEPEKTPYYTVCGITVRRTSVGDMVGDDELVVSDKVRLNYLLAGRT
jgi:hypothetical protein